MQKRSELLGEIADALPEIARHLIHGRPITSGEWELPLAQMRTLKVVAGQPGCTMSELAAKLGISMGAATGLVDRLVEQELVARGEDAGDRRRVCLRLAQAGEQAQQALAEYRRKRMAAALRELSGEQIEQIAQALALLRAALESRPR